MLRLPKVVLLAGAIAALSLAGCGGGSSGDASPTSGTLSGASAGSASTGTITAFGSVFVNGHEFGTGTAKVIDDDTGTTSAGTSALEVGMTVDIKSAANSTSSSPVADEVHLHPLVRGIVDASDSTAGTLTVMGQAVQLTASTNYSDHRACLTASPLPCSAITGQSSLAATAGAGGAAVAGSYVTVHGYLYSSGSTTGAANVVATLVSVADVPSGTAAINYKAEGVVTAVGSSAVTIAGLTVDLSGATCHAAGSVVPCASAFSAGQIVSVIGATEPALPATSFTATTARLRSKLVIATEGATIEVEGKVSSVTASPASFVVRGVTVDASALASGTLPAVGDEVKVLGTVASGGTSITATSVTALHAARSATFGLEGDAASVTAGSTSGTFVLTVLGQSVSVVADTRLADRSVHGSGGSSANPFNISTFQSYLAASTSQHLLVRSQVDANGKLSALSVTIVPASARASVSGVVDAAPAPVNGSGGTPSTFSVHGLAVSADPSSVTSRRHGGSSTATMVAAGELVLARGTYSGGVLTVAVPSGPLDRSSANIVIDSGIPSGKDHDGF
ncbi:MAG: hypothetical protein H7306_15340 [Bacteriovorax sp.]|nr:hypothetical protein [Rhizobacter sp.]